MNARARASTLLVADDDTIVLKLIGYNFDQAGLYCSLFETGDALLEKLGEETQACVLDLNMPGSSGLDCLKLIKERHPHVEVVILTNVNQAAEAVEAVRAGAFDYLTKPFDPDWLVRTVRKAMQLSRKQRENQELRSSFAESETQVRLLGDSPAMTQVKTLIERMGNSDNAVLLTGESGTGKTLIARALHAASGRRSGPFVAVSCPSLPGELLESEMFGHEKGAFSGATRRRLGRAELAHGGTLFLDEIGEMPLQLQTKLLTFLQDRSFFRLGGERSLSVDTRIVAATNQNLSQMVKDGLFREDLYFRLNVLPIEVPPLRDRPQDIAVLARDFLGKCAAHSGEAVPDLEASALERLLRYPWPGNIRELENAVARAFTLRQESGVLRTGDFQLERGAVSRLALDTLEGKPGEGRASLAGRALADIERQALVETLEACGGNKSEAARSLGIAEKSVYNKIKKFGIVT